MKIQTMKPLEQTIQQMLTENTGTHFLDSGGDNGRQWQRNQGRDFESEPEVVPNFWDGELEYVTVSVYHFLKQVLDTDEFSDDVNSFLEECREAYKDDYDRDAHWVQECMDELEDAGWDIENIKDPQNTYNWDNPFSQDFQYITFVHDGEPYVLLQIHGGADIRGGYTKTRCFKLTGYLATTDIYGIVNGIEVGTNYDGVNITTDDGIVVPVKEDDDYSFYFIPMEETYMYMD